MKEKKLRPIDLAYIAMAAALMAVCAWITIPAAVPFTLQTFAVFCTLRLLGGRRGTIATVVYLLLGAVGAPVFSGFRGGFGVLLGTTGGYLVGFVLSGLVYWLGERLGIRRRWEQAVTMAAGLIVCYVFGTIWFMTVYAADSGSIGVWTALGWCVIPFVLPDAAKLALALFVGEKLGKRLKLR